MNPDKQTGANGMTYTYTDFLADVQKAHSDMQGHWRFGQCYFNTMRSKRPALAEELRGSSFDPFHRDEVDQLTHNWARENW